LQVPQPTLSALLDWKRGRTAPAASSDGTHAALPLFGVPRDSDLVSTVRAMFAPGNSGSVLVTAPPVPGASAGSEAVVGLLSEKGYVSALTHGSAPPAAVTAHQLVAAAALSAAQPGTPVIR
jgi:hypothetical protein